MSTLATDMSSLLKDGFCHDLTLVFEGGKQLKVHRNIMGARCIVFRTMLEVDMKENRTGIIEIKDFDPEVATEFVNFLYSNKISTDFTNIVDLLKIAHQYQVSSLVKKCVESIVKQEVNTSNVVNLVTLAEDFQILGLSGKCARLLEDLSDKCHEILGEKMEILDPNEVDSLPSSLIRKSFMAYKMKTNLKYDALFAHPTRKQKRLQGSIYTKFNVNSPATVSGVGLFMNEDNFIEVELNKSDGSLITSTCSIVTSYRFPKLVKILFQKPGNLVPGAVYTVKTKFEKDFTFFKADNTKFEVNVDMEDRRVKVCIVNGTADIPVLFFKDHMLVGNSL